MGRIEPKKENRRNARERAGPFASQEALLEGAREMFRNRRTRCEVEKNKDPEQIRRARLEESDSSRQWHRSVRMTGQATPFSALCARKRLNRIEREVLIALVLERLAQVDGRVDNCADLIGFLGLSGAESLAALRALSDAGRLHRAGLIDYEDPEEDLRDRTVYPDPALVESFLDPSNARASGWPVANEQELWNRLSTLTSALRALAEAHDDEHRGYGSRRDSRKALRRVDLLLRGLQRTLQTHTDWKLGALFSPESNFDWSERVILLALIGKEIGHLPFDDRLYLGGGLARAATAHAGGVGPRARMLLSSGRLQRAKLIQPCGGCEPLLSEDENTVVEVEFELASRGLGLFGLDRRVRRRRFSRFNPRNPVVRLDQLVLTKRVSAALQMALAHARHSRILLDDWGLAEVLPYGRTIGILLAGPPGVGKTASAEAIAHELGRQILVVDYSEVQNCYTGQTEKNIVRIFREARTSQAVLFWDEADAMFYDRNSTQHTWENRDVNVLLQELERFEGVCILATNRKVTLDAALSRRISIKIEFERPDRALRLRIWKQLLPRRLPLGADVNLDQLAQADLTGGEIKNVTVNAARLALLRGAKTRVSMADFERALQQELANRWGTEERRPLGFHTRSEG